MLLIVMAVISLLTAGPNPFIAYGPRADLRIPRRPGARHRGDLMCTDRVTARIVGVLFIVGTVTAVVGGALVDSITEPDAVVEVAGSKGQIVTGALLEMVLALSVVGIAVMIYPVLKRRDEGLALGYVGVRMLEAVLLLAASIERAAAPLREPGPRRGRNQGATDQRPRTGRPRLDPSDRVDGPARGGRAHPLQPAPPVRARSCLVGGVGPRGSCPDPGRGRTGVYSRRCSSSTCRDRRGFGGPLVAKAPDRRLPEPAG